MADISKIPYREIEIDGVVAVPESVTEEDFWHNFIRWIEGNGYTFGGGINEIKPIIE